MNRAKILGVAEIVLSVADLAAMRDFYVEVMGFPVDGEACSPHPDSDPDNTEATISFLKIGDMDSPLGRNRHPQVLALIDYRRHVFARPRFDGHDVRKSTLNHLAFEILLEDYEAEFERLEGLGLSPMRTEFPNLLARAIFFKDPEGNTLELICHDDSVGSDD